MKQSLYLLWLEGVDPTLLDRLPSLEQVRQHGTDAQLTPQPLAEQRQCYYQLMTGMGAGNLGRYDAVHPVAYSAQSEAQTAEGATGQLIQDILRKRKLTATALEISQSIDLNALQDLHLDFALVHLLQGQKLTFDVLDELVQHFIQLVPTSAHLAILTDVWTGTIHSQVNINDFLADTGLLDVTEPRSTTHVNWSETLAYGLGTGQVWINMHGREPQGIVHAGNEYHEVCDALINELRTHWLDPRNGQPIIAQVFKKEELYAGDYLFKAPDLITLYQPGYAASAHAVQLGFDGHSVLPGNAEPAQQTHTAYARLLMSGPAFTSMAQASGQLIDLIPTIMYLLAQPIPAKADGQVLLALFTQDFQQQHVIQRADDETDLLSDEEEGMIVDRLRDLGYLG